MSDPTRLTLTDEECDEARKQAWILVVPALKNLEDWAAFLVKHTDFERALAREGASHGLQRAAVTVRQFRCGDHHSKRCLWRDELIHEIVDAIDREREGADGK